MRLLCLPCTIGQHVASSGMPVSLAAHFGCRRQSPDVVGDTDGDSEGSFVGADVVGDTEGSAVGASVLSQHGRYVLWSIAGQQSMLWPSANQCPQRGCRLQWPGDVGAGVGAGVGGRDSCIAHHSSRLMDGGRVGASDGRAVTITGNVGECVGDRDGECDGQSVSGPKQQSRYAPWAWSGQHVPV